jgi:putative endonuclease
MNEVPSVAWFVYLLECDNGKLYCGITTDLAARFWQHVAGTGAKFTRANRPSHMIAAKLCQNRSEASKLECSVKRLLPEHKRVLALQWPVVPGVSACRAQKKRCAS